LAEEKGQEDLLGFEKGSGFFLPEHKTYDPRVQAGEGPEEVYKMGIRQETEVHYDIGLQRQAETIAEGNDRDGEFRLAGQRPLLQKSKHLLPKVMNVQGRGIDQMVGTRPEGMKEISFFLDTGRDRIVRGQGVASPRLRKTAEEDLVPRIQKKEPEPDPVRFQGLKVVFKILEKALLSGVHDDGDPVVRSGRRFEEFDQMRKKFAGEVVDGEITGIFQRIEG